jgi:hypothetical protein
MKNMAYKRRNMKTFGVVGVNLVEKILEVSSEYTSKSYLLSQETVEYFHNHYY